MPNASVLTGMRISAVTRPVVPAIDDGLCNGCTRCVEACAYGAMRMEKVGSANAGAANAGGKAAAKARVTPERCIGCGLCVSVCPTDAISQVYYGHSGLR